MKCQILFSIKKIRKHIISLVLLNFPMVFRVMDRFKEDYPIKIIFCPKRENSFLLEQTPFQKRFGVLESK